MTDHANELRRYARKIAHPAGDVPSVMLAAAEEIERLAARLEAAEKERDDVAQQLVQSEQGKRKISEECDTLRVKIARMERQVPICRAEDLKYAESLLPALGLKPENPLYALPGAQQCKNCNGMGDRFDPSGEKIPCDLCESRLEEIRSLVAEAAHDIISGSDFWLSISLAAKKLYALPGAKGE